jgi:hypothetical protein
MSRCLMFECSRSTKWNCRFGSDVVLFDLRVVEIMETGKKSHIKIIMTAVGSFQYYYFKKWKKIEV